MAEPKRREQRRTHLDASVVPVERALLARAGEIGSHLDVARRAARVHGLDEGAAALIGAVADTAAEIIATEFRDLAEELHWW